MMNNEKYENYKNISNKDIVKWGNKLCEGMIKIYFLNIICMRWLRMVKCD